MLANLELEGSGLVWFGGSCLPIGSIAVPFWGLPYRILHVKPSTGTTLEPINRHAEHQDP